ncbi:hypothetical protein FACS1894184_10150 [Clostridia bacterium]|nr:hypothetical protein FACS1894184_10150 [Clostridia bacterium]
MELTFINAGGVTMTFKQTPPFFLSKVDGIGTIGNTINSFKAPDQDGSFFVGSTRDMRNITIEGTIVANNTDEAYVLRRKLLNLFTPKMPGTFIFRDRKITCVVDDVKLISSSKERLPRFLISLLCPSPYFEALDPIIAELALWQPLFKFQLIIPQEGIQMGARKPNQIIEVINAGDSPCGCKVTFSALGVVMNPELRNIDSGEYIRVNRTMVAGEELHIHTSFAGKRVISVVGGVETNIFSQLDTGSTFLQFETGTNVLRYDAEQGLDLLEVSLEYSALFAGI